MEEQTRKSWETWHLAVAIVVALLVGLGLGVMVSGDDDLDRNTAAAVVNTAPATFPPTTERPPPTGTRSTPVPLARTAALDNGWTIKVVETQPDASSVVAAADPNNAPPAPGNRYYIVHVAMTYTGPQPAAQRSDVHFATIGTSDVAYEDDASCGVVPNELSSIDVPHGGTITGNLCWSVTNADAASLLLVVDDATRTDDDPVFFALD